jgi:hypothetical protein
MTSATTVRMTTHSLTGPCAVVLMASPPRIVLNTLNPAYCTYANSQTSSAPIYPN